jgi:histidine triad (HIT) family protein
MTSPGTEPCIFCRIVAGESPAHRVHEDDSVLVFMDIRPVAEGHTLIIPKAHYENLFEASEEAMAAVARVSVRIANAIRAVLSPDGVFVAQTNGAAAGQTVFHYHLHLIPRWLGGPLQVHGRIAASSDDLAAMASRIRDALGGAPVRPS